MSTIIIGLLRTTMTVTPAQHSQNISTPNFHFFHTSVSNKSSLHHHFAASATVPQAVILGRGRGEQKRRNSELKESSGPFFCHHRQPRHANTSHDMLLLPDKQGVLVAGRPKTSGNSWQPNCSSLFLRRTR